MGMGVNKKERMSQESMDAFKELRYDLEAAAKRNMPRKSLEGVDFADVKMSLARKWGEAAGYLIVVGDPDQNLYQWRGSDPEVFVEPAIPEEQMRVLSQSYRIPQAVHAAAVKWIERTPGRTPVEYYPRDVEGEVRHINAPWPHAEQILRDMQNYLDRKSVV